MPRFEDALAYASFLLLGLAVALGGAGLLIDDRLLGAGTAPRLLQAGGAAGLAAAIVILASARLADRRLRREERRPATP
jgi:hypothetical protein